MLRALCRVSRAFGQTQPPRLSWGLERAGISSASSSSPSSSSGLLCANERGSLRSANVSLPASVLASGDLKDDSPLLGGIACRFFSSTARSLGSKEKKKGGAGNKKNSKKDASKKPAEKRQFVPKQFDLEVFDTITRTDSGAITHEGRRPTPYPFNHPFFSKEASLPRGFLDPNRRKKTIIPLEDRVDPRPQDLTIEVPITNLKKEDKGTTLLNYRIFDAPVRPDVVHQVVVWQLARRRAGTACVKTRATVNYSRRKIYKQKGTGGARHGSRGAPIFRGGGRAHGPIPRSFDFKLNTKLKKMAMRSVLTSRRKTNKLFIVDDMEIEDFKTKSIAKILKEHEWSDKRVLYYFWDEEPNLNRASSNIPSFKSKHVKAISAYDILRNDVLLLNKSTLHYLTMRYKPL